MKAVRATSKEASTNKNKHLARRVQLDATRQAARRAQISSCDKVTVRPAQFERKANASG